jgi:hypothetical protein
MVISVPPFNVFHLHVALSVSDRSPHPSCLDPVSRPLTIHYMTFLFRSFTVYVRNFTVK